jgi:ABC-type transport system substrate-binding protein
MAVDRNAIVSNLLDSLGHPAFGPFARAQWSADTTLRQIPFDRAAAARLLDSLGWVAGKDGIRARAGRPLAFTVLLPGSSADRQRLAVLLQEQWRQVGVQVKIENADFSAFSASIHSGRFDATLNQLSPAPSPNGLRQNWSTAALSMSNGMNLGHYADPALDVEIDSALNATTPVSGRAHYRAAYQALLDAAPAIWLYEPVVVAGFNKRVTTGPLRPDAWWASIPNWRVSNKTQPRDSTARHP